MTVRVWIYRLATGICRLVIRTFFAQVEVVGQQNVPTSGPTLFILNHPNGLLDALFVVLYSGRKTSLLVKAPLFRTPVVGFFVRQLESLPVYRKQDNDNPRRNKQLLLESIAFLRRGNALTLFPEGTSHSDFEVKKLRTGAARIALSSSSKTVSPDAAPVHIVPTGLYYTDKEAFRSKALVVFGKPLSTPDVALDTNFRPPGSLVAQFTKTLRAALSDLVLTAPTQSTFYLARNLEHAMSAHSSDEQRAKSHSQAPRPLSCVRDTQQALIDGYMRIEQESPERIAQINSLVESHAQTLSRARLPMDQTLEFSLAKIVLCFGWACLCVLVLAPLLIVGFSTNCLTCLVIDYVAKRHAKGETDITASGKAVLGLSLLPATWLTASIIIGVWLGGAWFGPMLLLMPAAAYITLFTLEWAGASFRRTYAAVLLTLRPALRRTIAKERAQLVTLAQELL